MRLCWTWGSNSCSRRSNLLQVQRGAVSTKHCFYWWKDQYQGNYCPFEGGSKAVRLLSPKYICVSTAQLIKSHLYQYYWNHVWNWNMLSVWWLLPAEVSDNVTPSANPHFWYWFLRESQFKCTLKNVLNVLFLHPFLSCNINTKLYNRELPPRQIRCSYRRELRLSISYQLTAGFLFSCACFIKATSTRLMIFLSSKSQNESAK